MKLLENNRRWKRAKLNFWLYVEREVLEHFFQMMREGRFGKIRRATGHSQDRMGNAISFVYEKGKVKFRWPDKSIAPEIGYMEMEGDFTSQDLLQIRNHTAFHLRAFFKVPVGTHVTTMMPTG